MAEQFEEIEQAAFVMVPVDLVRSAASKNALLCFLIMGSFGRESRAKVASIASRMRVKEKQIVRDAQVELVDLGFIRLKKMESEHEPRHWSLWPFRNWEEGAEETGGGKKRPPEKAPPKHINIKQADRSLLAHKAAIGTFMSEWQGSSNYSGQKYIPTGKDHANLKRLLQEGVEPELFSGKLKAFMLSRDPFDIGQRHSLSLFCSTFNKWPFIPAGIEAAGPQVKL